MTAPLQLSGQVGFSPLAHLCFARASGESDRSETEPVRRAAGTTAEMTGLLWICTPDIQAIHYWGHSNLNEAVRFPPRSRPSPDQPTA